MISVFFSCGKCGCSKGNIIAFNSKIEIECVQCGNWEVMKEETDSKHKE